MLEAVVCAADPPLHSPFRRTGNFTTCKREENGRGRSRADHSQTVLPRHVTTQTCLVSTSAHRLLQREQTACSQLYTPRGTAAVYLGYRWGYRWGSARRGVEPTKATATTQHDYQLTKDFKQNWKVSHLSTPMHHTICSGRDDARSHLLGLLPLWSPTGQLPQDSTHTGDITHNALSWHHQVAYLGSCDLVSGAWPSRDGWIGPSPQWV